MFQSIHSYRLYQLLKGYLANNQAEPLRSTHEFIDDRRPNGINKMYNDLQHKHHKKQRWHNS